MGAILGVPMGLSLARELGMLESLPRAALCVVAIGAGTGYLAMRYGDRFWEKILPWIWWL